MLEDSFIGEEKATEKKSSTISSHCGNGQRAEKQLSRLQ
jgi:hypothetical protein